MTNCKFEEIRRQVSADKLKEFDNAIQNLNKQIDQIIQEYIDFQNDVMYGTDNDIKNGADKSITGFSGILKHLDNGVIISKNQLKDRNS